MYRFFVQKENMDEEAGTIRIAGEDAHHIRSVLRMRPGEEVLLCSGLAEDPVDYLCRIEQVQEDEVLTRIERTWISEQELPCRMILFQGLPKGDKLEEIIQKSVELGVSQVVPVMMERSVVKLDGKKTDRKVQRWNAIALSAAKQSKRGVIPKVLPPVPFDTALRMAQAADLLIVPYERADGIAYTRKVLSSAGDGESCGVFIGPEGGFSEEEIRMLREAGAKIVTLGHRILRTETAGPAVLAALMLNTER